MRHNALHVKTAVSVHKDKKVVFPLQAREAQRVGRCIAPLFHDRGTGRGWVVSSKPRPHFTPGKEPVPIVQKAGWAPGPVWTGGKSRPTGVRSPDRPARTQSLYRLSYSAHRKCTYSPVFRIAVVGVSSQYMSENLLTFTTHLASFPTDGK